MSVEALWYQSFRHGRPPKIRELTKADKRDKTIPMRLAWGYSIGACGYRPVMTEDRKAIYYWPRSIGDWWAVDDEIIEQINVMLDKCAWASANSPMSAKITQDEADRRMAEEQGLIVRLHDARIAQKVDPRQRGDGDPDPLPKKLRDRVNALLARRAECAEWEVEALDWMIIELVQP